MNHINVYSKLLDDGVCPRCECRGGVRRTSYREKRNKWLMWSCLKCGWSEHISLDQYICNTIIFTVIGGCAALVVWLLSVGVITLFGR